MKVEFLVLILVLMQFVQICSGVRAALRLKKKANSADENDDEDYQDEIDDQIYDKASIFEQGETHDFLQFLRSIKYDHRQVPGDGEDGPVHVNVSIVVSNIRSVSEVTMDYSIEMFYRESWRDPRLIYSEQKFKNKTEISLHESYSNFLWHPDTFVPNAISSKNPRRQSITHRSLLRLRSNGSILYSRRLSLILTCGMDLTLFPFDSQLCKMGFESYGYTADKVKYLWSKGAIQSLKLHKIRLPDFQIKEAYVTNRVESYATGDYSRLYVCFVFNRAAGFCFLQLIIPSTAVVITSWVSLWMENETSFQDMISIILTITFLLFSYNEVMPRVSYIKAMDVYLGVCFCIVFLSLIKLAVVKYMRQRLLITRQQDLPYYSNMKNQPLLAMNPVEMSVNQLTKIPEATVIEMPSGETNEEDTSIVAAGMLPMLRLVNGVSSPGNNSADGFTYENTSALKKVSLSPPELYTQITMDSNGSTTPVCRQNRTKGRSNDSWFEFSPTFMHRFHWITQMTFFFGFVIFCLFYFLVYPNIHTQLTDDDCDRELAEWFAEVT